MDSSIDDLLVQTAQKIQTTTNVFGDVVYGARTNTKCLYRDISSQQRSAGNRYEVDVTGILWFDAAENVVKGDIYLLDDGNYYQIEQVLFARTRVTDNVVQFIKCTVSRQRQVS